MATVKFADEALLASLGYKQEFKRAFTPLEVFGVSFSIIGLLPSIASVLFYALPNGGGPAMVWGWAVASLFILLVGMSMAELASAAPTSGGLYYWTYQYSSPKTRNLLCWTVGYANTIANIGGVASINWACAVQIMAAANIGSGGTFSSTPAQLFGVYAAVIVTQIVINCLGTVILARLQNLYIVLNIMLCFAVIIALPICTPPEFKNSASFALGEFINIDGWPNGFAFLLSFMAPLWTITAFDSSVNLSEEASNAAVAVPWAIVSSTGLAGVLGTAINMVLAFCMGTDVNGLLENDPMLQIFFQSFGQKATLALWAVVIIVQYMMGNSMLLAASRQTYAFSRDQALPFSNWLYRLNGRTGAPVNTVVFVALIALAMGLLVFAGEVAIDAIFSIGLVSLYIAYSIPIAARFLGGQSFKPGPFHLGVFSAPIAATSVIFMAVMSVIFLFPPSPQTTAADMNYSVAVTGGAMLLSLVWYYFPKYGGVHWFKGPRTTVGAFGTPRSQESPAPSDEKVGGRGNSDEKGHDVQQTR